MDEHGRQSPKEIMNAGGKHTLFYSQVDATYYTWSQGKW